MAGFPPIDAPTAAVIGGVSGFVADNLTGVIQRRLKRRGEEKRKKLEWYESTSQLAKEIAVATVAYETTIEVRKTALDETFPTESEVSDAIDNSSIDELLDREIEMGGIPVDLGIEFESGSPQYVQKSDLPLNEIKANAFRELDSEKFDREKDIFETIKSEMDDYQDRVIKQYAHAPMELDEEVGDTLIKLISDIFRQTIHGEITEDERNEITETCNEVISVCNQKRKELSDSRGIL